MLNELADEKLIAETAPARATYEDAAWDRKMRRIRKNLENRMYIPVQKLSPALQAHRERCDKLDNYRAQFMMDAITLDEYHALTEGL